jgi:DNA-binding PadR family transcriptional regulator
MTCKHGHPRTEENTYVNERTGWRSCRECRRSGRRPGKLKEHVAEIRRRYKAGEGPRSIARALGATEASVAAIAHGWSYPDPEYQSGRWRTALQQSILAALSTRTQRAPVDVINRVREDYGSVSRDHVSRLLARAGRMGLAVSIGGPHVGRRYLLSAAGKEKLDELMGWNNEDEDEWEDDEEMAS